METGREKMREFLGSSPEVEIDIVGTDLKRMREFLDSKAEPETRLLVTRVYEPGKTSSLKISPANVNKKIIDAINFAEQNGLSVRLRQDGEKRLFCVKTKRKALGTGPDNREEFEVPVSLEEEREVEEMLVDFGFTLSDYREKERTSYTVSLENINFKVDVDKYPAVGTKNENSLRAHKVEVEGPGERKVLKFAEKIIQESGAGGVLGKSSEAEFLKSQGYKKKQIRNLRFNYE